MTKPEVTTILKNLGELALEYAKKGELDTVASINNTIADVAKRYEDVLKG